MRYILYYQPDRKPAVSGYMKLMAGLGLIALVLLIFDLTQSWRFVVYVLTGLK